MATKPKAGQKAKDTQIKPTGQSKDSVRDSIEQDILEVYQKDNEALLESKSQQSQAQ